MFGKRERKRFEKLREDRERGEMCKEENAHVKAKSGTLVNNPVALMTATEESSSTSVPGQMSVKASARNVNR